MGEPSFKKLSFKAETHRDSPTGLSADTDEETLTIRKRALKSPLVVVKLGLGGFSDVAFKDKRHLMIRIYEKL